MAYGDFKDLTTGTASDKTLRDKVFNNAKNPRYDGYRKGQWSIKFSIKNFWQRYYK